MPLYQHIIVTLPQATEKSLAEMFQRYAKVICSFKGNIRGIENHGIRNLPERTMRRFPAMDGSRHFWDARYVTVTFDGSPGCLSEAKRFLLTEENLLRQFVIKTKSNVDLSKATTYKNPYSSVK